LTLRIRNSAIPFSIVIRISWRFRTDSSIADRCAAFADIVSVVMTGSRRAVF
jgi:hypothetical protein